MSLAPNIFDWARVERVLKSMNDKLSTIEQIMIDSEDQDRFEDEE